VIATKGCDPEWLMAEVLTLFSLQTGHSQRGKITTSSLTTVR
jgi:hypothetical protein